MLARGSLPNILLLNLIRTLLGFLLLLCLIVPGVIYLVRTSMANHLLIANPKMKAVTALKASNKVMSGRTGEYLALCCSYIGWWFIGILTFGLGFVFISPYMKLAKTVYYKRNLQGDKANYVAEPQPLSPPPQAPQENYADGRFVPAPPHGKKKQATDPAVPPIETLEAADVKSMNDAARLVTGSEVPEVVIPMPTAVNAPHTHVSDSFTETVKPLTTQEVMDSDVDSKKFDEMFAELQRQAEEIEAAKTSGNFVEVSTSGSDDFGSPESAPPDDAPPAHPSQDAASARGRDRVERVAARRPSARPVTRERASSASAVDRASSANGSADASETNAGTEQGESREERLRREREERRARIERNKVRK